MAHEARPGALPPTVLSARSGMRGAREVAEEAETVASGGNIAVATLQSQPQLGRVSLGGTAAIEVDGERYVREALLGIGGMGEVHLHTDRRIGRHVAMKTLLGGQAGETSVVRFIREARVQGQLEHPAVVPVYDLGTDVDGRPCFTMKRIHGHSLSRILADLARQRAEPRAQPSRYTLRKLLGAFVQVALAVEYAHERGVIHRDLKPANIMLGDFGEVYVLDWGLAKLVGDVDFDFDSDETVDQLAAPLHDQNLPQVTRHGDLLGTPAYMAPEQLRRLPVDARADVFALGAILFEILTLESFRRADSLSDIMTESQGTTDRPSDRASDVPPELDALCAHALAPDLAARTASALEVARGVERYLEGDRDASARRALADQHLAAARARVDGGASDPRTRAGAIRETMKALVLRPDDEEIQRLLVSLVEDHTGAIPAEAERELDVRMEDVRREGARWGIYGFIGWMLSLPLAAFVGVRSWPIAMGLLIATALCIAVAWLMKQGRVDARRAGLGLSVLSAAVVVVTSGWLGPFVLFPAAAVATATMFALHATRDERLPHIAVWSVASLLTFGVELSGLVPPAYTFVDGGIVLHPRLLELPKWPTLAVLAYTTLSFVALTMLFVGRLRDSQRDAERRLFIQAWHLRQLFDAPTSRLSDRGVAHSSRHGAVTSEDDASTADEMCFSFTLYYPRIKQIPGWAVPAALAKCTPE